MAEEIKVDRLYSFVFKKTTVGGSLCKFQVKVYVGNDNVIKVSKRFLDTKGNLPFKVLRKFKKVWLYEEVMAFKEQTMIDILMNSLSIIYPNIYFKISGTEKDESNQSS